MKVRGMGGCVVDGTVRMGGGLDDIQNFASGLFCCLPHRTDKLAN
jgi:hypothetical protein